MTNSQRHAREPIAVLRVVSQSTAQALAAVLALNTVALLERAIAAERRCQARSAVLDALSVRLSHINRSPTKNRKTSRRKP